MEFFKAKRIVVKIGSALLLENQSAKVRKAWLATLVEDIAALQKQGKQVIVVSSGAVALGRKYIGADAKRELRLEEKQAAAACGQARLVKRYHQLLKRHKLSAAQILLTIQDTEDRRRYLNAKNTIETLIEANVVPIINENDTIATSELRFGDNDRLAARVAQMVGAELLVLLSDVDGLYTENPRVNPKAEHIPIVEDITESIEAMAGVSVSQHGSGGMMTKIDAAKMAIQSGCDTVITLGKPMNPLSALNEGATHTRIVSNETPLSARKHWIASSLHTRGEIIVDQGAVEALNAGKSLLPVGVIDVKGNFGRGDAVVIKDWNLKEIGKGLVAYGSKDADLIKGQRSQEITNIVGFSGRNALIHRDDLTLL